MSSTKSHNVTPIRYSAQQPSDGDSDVSSMQNPDSYDRSLREQAGKLKTIDRFTFDTMEVRRDLADAIILHDYPLSIVDHRIFRKLFQSVYPKVSQKTLSKDITKLYEFKRDASMRLFKKSESRIAITVDKWVSSDQSRRFIAISGQMTDENWKIHRRMMRFVNIPSSCTNKVIAKLTVECLFDWEIATKISSISIDDGLEEGTNDIIVDYLSDSHLLLKGKRVHLRCFARTMSLLAKECFEVIEGVLQKIRESILFWTETPQREREFREGLRELSISDRTKLVLDSVSSWNTTYLMLKLAIRLRDVFSYLRRQESKYRCIPSEEEWGLAGEICGKLKVLYDTLNVVSAYHCPNLFFVNLCDMKSEIAVWEGSSNELIKNMASKMLKIFDRYWNSVWETFAAALALSHKYKLSGVEAHLKTAYGEGSDIQGVVEDFNASCEELFMEYQNKESENRVGNKRKREQQNEQHTEWNEYLEKKIAACKIIFESPNALLWWKDADYPVLKKMARDILSIPVISVAPEHIFDVREHRVLSAHRSRCHPTMVEKLMCSQSWQWTDIKGSYSVTNSFSWGTEDYAVK